MSMIDDTDFDRCDRHDDFLLHEYDFGAMDVVVIVYHCGCARTVDVEGMGSTMHDSYSKAESNARYIVAKNGAR